MVGVDFKSVLGEATKLVGRFGDEAYYIAVCLRSGMIGVELPHRLVLMVRAFERFGAFGGALSVAALRHGRRIGLIDELGALTFGELEERSNALANAWRERGLLPGDGVAILARNHRGFLDAFFAAAKCGARIVLLNTDLAAPQIREVVAREGTDLLVSDEEYTGMLDDVELRHGRWRAWAQTPGEDTLEALIATGKRSLPPRPEVRPKLVLLTSGTTGSPKGAPRSEPRTLAPLGGLLAKVPFRAREVTECCAPLFHALGCAHTLLAVALGSTLVVRRRFDPQETIDSVARNRATALVAVPVMLQRMLDLGDQARAGRDHSRLKIIFVSGSQLRAELCRRAMAAFGPVVYNMYGSTEVAFATIATPEDLVAEPACAGQVVHGAVVKILDEFGAEVPAGGTGRIFVGNAAQFEGYTGGGTKETIRGLMSTGDVGHFDDAGRLFIDGRDDEMIVSGGENVFPSEVEELLVRHGAVAEAAVVGVPDERFGQRLRAFVVLRAGKLLTGDEVKDFVRENLARYKTPREVVFLDELPRNPTGKVLKRQLQQFGAAPS